MLSASPMSQVQAGMIEKQWAFLHQQEHTHLMWLQTLLNVKRERLRVRGELPGKNPMYMGGGGEGPEYVSLVHTWDERGWPSEKGGVCPRPRDERVGRPWGGGQADLCEALKEDLQGWLSLCSAKGMWLEGEMWARQAKSTKIFLKDFRFDLKCNGKTMKGLSRRVACWFP